MLDPVHAACSWTSVIGTPGAAEASTPAGDLGARADVQVLHWEQVAIRGSLRGWLLLVSAPRRGTAAAVEVDVQRSTTPVLPTL